MTSEGHRQEIMEMAKKGMAHARGIKKNQYKTHKNALFSHRKAVVVPEVAGKK